MDAKEAATQITTTILNKISVPSNDDPHYISKWAAKCYKIVFNAVLNPELEKE